jgi:hypothetical protein
MADRRVAALCATAALIAIVVGVLLWLRSSGEPARPRPGSTPSAATPSAAAATSGPIRWAAPAGPQAPSGPVPSLTHQTFRHTIRDQIAAVHAATAKCIAGSRASGHAVVTFMIAHHGDEVVIEDTGVDYDETSLEDGPLLACLRETSREMHFDELPEGAGAVQISRTIELDRAEIRADRVTEYANLPQ